MAPFSSGFVARCWLTTVTKFEARKVQRDPKFSKVSRGTVLSTVRSAYYRDISVSINFTVVEVPLDVLYRDSEWKINFISEAPLRN